MGSLEHSMLLLSSVSFPNACYVFFPHYLLPQKDSFHITHPPVSPKVFMILHLIHVFWSLFDLILQ